MPRQIEITTKINDDMDVTISRDDVLIHDHSGNGRTFSVTRQDFRAIAAQIGEYERLVAFQRDTVAA